MAKSQTVTQKAVPPAAKAAEQREAALAVQQQGGSLAKTPPSVDQSMFEADAGGGMEGATSEAFAIPFLSVLQSNSPQVDEASAGAIAGARAGMLFENVTGKMTPRGEAVRFVPCAFRRVFLRWGPRGGDGAGFKGEMTADMVAQERAAGKIVEMEGRLYYPLADGSVNREKCDRVSDARNHYILILDANDSWQQALLSLGSTQIKKSKNLMAALASVKRAAGNGSMFTPPTWASVVSATTIPESNEKGNWFGIRMELTGQVGRADLYVAAKAFRDSVTKGEVVAKYAEEEPGHGDAFGEGGEGGDGGDGKF